MKPLTEIPVEWIRSQLSSMLPPNEMDELIQSLKTPAPVSFRINPQKQSTGLSLPNVPWCIEGYYLEERPSFTHDPLFHTGSYYVQEASSMFIDFIFKSFLETTSHNKNVVVLDACASPGGKSTLLASNLVGQGVLVANEMNKKRFQILEENCIKWGTGNIIPVSATTGELATFTGYFDFIVADAPCSGEGLWRKNPDSIEEWSEENVEMCSTRQKEILSDLWKCLKPGGWLVYSTCTFNKQENEETISWLTSAMNDVEGVDMKVPADWNIQTSEISGISCSRFFPCKIRGEGFFVAVMQKKNANTPSKGKMSAFTEKLREVPFESLFTTKKVWWKNKNKHVLAADENVFDVLSEISRLNYSDKIFEVHATETDTFSPYLAWRTDLRPEFFPVLEVNPDEAISFVMCDTSRFKLSIADRVTHLVAYKGHGLGFIRKIGNSVRIDYPKAWRILKQGKAKPVF
ncbi:MAG: hypothetical protein ACHQF2_01605 [Flavobacteriales bacterium]